MIRFAATDVFLVTGASSGIGRSVALLLNELGATVIGVGRDTGRLAAMRASAKAPDRLHVEVRDLAKDLEQLPGWVAGLVARHGQLKGLMHAAGAIKIEPLRTYSLNEARKLFDLNFFSGLLLAKAFSRKGSFAESGASLLFCSSIHAIRGMAGVLTYSATKGAIEASVRSLAAELRNKRIRVNAVCPGYINTEMTRLYPPKDGHPLADPETVAPLCAFLLSDRAHLITGQSIVIDGGECL